jgi:hypothetical protein
MRNGQNKRMRGRNRNNKGHHGGGGGHHHNPLTRIHESNGPDVKIRGTAHHIAEKYLQLARDAQASGDPVTAENHFQHAEHYFRLIAVAQEQFRQQNPYYQAPPAPGEGNRDDGMDDGDDDMSQPTQIPQNFGNQQPTYPPREQPQPYQPQPQLQQSRPQHQQYQPQSQPPQQYQQPQPPFPPQPQFQPQPGNVDVSDVERLPSFITGSQPPQPAPQQSFGQGNQGGNQGNYDNQGGGDRFPRHRRRRHRGSGGPRPDMPNVPQDFRGDDGPDDSRPQ